MKSLSKRFSERSIEIVEEVLEEDIAFVKKMLDRDSELVVEVLEGDSELVVEVLEGDSELGQDGLGKLLQQLSLPGVSPHSPQHAQHGLLLQRPGDPLLFEH